MDSEKPVPEPRDQLFRDPLDNPGLFTFNESVAEVFPNMIDRSVPGYNTVIALTGTLAAQHTREGSNIYDLGCSWGASLLSVARQKNCRYCKLIGIDNSEAMLSRAHAHLMQYREGELIQLRCEDIIEAPIENASVVVMNYTLQFIPLAKRTGLLRRIHQAMRPGDALILSEKLVFPDANLNNYFIELHHEFKRQQGYSDLEIARKREALEDVLIAETQQTHLERLTQVGFSRADVWFQCMNFASLIAIA